MNRRERFNRLHEIREVAESLRAAPIEAPDFTSSILDRVDVERPFLAPSVRRRLPWVRIGLGACVAMTALGMALTHRWAPKAVQLAEQPAPISDVVSCVECAAYKRVVAIRPVRFNVTERDATDFLAAMATMASLSENEGRSTGMTGDEAPIMMGPMAPLSQAVAINTPAPSAPKTTLASSHVAARFLPSITPPQSMLTEGFPRAAIFAGEAPTVKVVPTFLEHDLDGLVLPR